MKVLFAFLLLLAAFTSTAQNRITGSVSDEKGAPVESVSVTLIANNDTAEKKSTVCDATGAYYLTNIPAGKYSFLISSVGFITSQIPDILVSGTKQVVQVPVIVLKRQNNELSSVSVVVKKPFIEQKSDRILVNVDASPANAGTSVMDVLEKSPGVSVDKDGNISLKGKQGVTIMIDNRPTYMSGTQLATYLKACRPRPPISLKS